MTTQFRFTWFEEPMDVSIDRNGLVSFNDRDLEYDIAFSAMGGDLSAAQAFLARWEDSRWSIVIGVFGVDEDFMCRLLVDCVDHVLPIYQARFGDDKNPENAVSTSRKILDGEQVPKEIATAIRRYVSGSANDREEFIGSPLNQYRDVANAARNLIRSAMQLKWRDGGFYGAVSTTIMIGLSDCSDAVAANTYGIKSKRDAARLAERDWQWRRFYDAKTALDAGKSWPPMGVTP